MPLFIVGGSFYQCWRRHFEQESTKDADGHQAREKEDGRNGDDQSANGNDGKKKIELSAILSEKVRGYKELAYRLDSLAHEFKQLMRDLSNATPSVAKEEDTGSSQDLLFDSVLAQERTIQELMHAHMSFASHLRAIDGILREKADFTQDTLTKRSP